MTEGETRRRLGLILALIVLVVMAITLFAALPARAHHVSDGGVDEPWVEAMNQESYWESRFATTQFTVDCTKFSDHSGFIPESYEAAVIKDGNMVRVYNPAPNDAVALGAVNPANNQHFASPHSWVMKCDFYPVTTTTVPEDDDTTTTTIQDTTTTTAAETTTTTIQDTTTTTIADTTTTTIADSTTTTQASTTTTDPTGSTLPFTGADDGLLVGLGASALAFGALLLFAVRREEDGNGPA